jgi:phosphotransferase system  glucose/maltose/N-acetylglucosamine-specific IIC component
MTSDHFQGKTVVEHLKEARTKGTLATYETHGTELPGYLSAGADGAKETAFVLILLWLLLEPQFTHLFLLFSAGWIFWKIGRSALLGWARLQRLHRLIEEERWEIEHNREQERQEIKALYRAKGLTGKLLDEVISVLMADDNRLLRIMLEEELGLTLEIYEHPLKQSAGAAAGVLLSAGLFIGGAFIFPFYGPIIASLLAIGLASYIAAKAEKNKTLEAVIWNLSLAAFSSGIVYFLKML